MTQKRSVLFLMQHFISQNIKVVKPISKPKKTKKDLRKESQLDYYWWGGQPCGSGFRHETPKDLGAASSITDFFVLLDSLDSEYQKYHRNVEGCFIIDKALLPDNTSLVYIGLWYVPSRNEASFWFNNKDIPEYLLHRVTQCEPQIWVFAKPFA